MDLWIRSQDEKLLEKVESIELLKLDEYIEPTIYSNSEHILGTYKTIKRAKEILDEIQHILVPSPIINTTTFISTPTSPNTLINSDISKSEITPMSVVVYQMPKK